MAKVLLIDHNPQIRLLTKKLIETREGWLVTEAIDSYDAVVQVVKLKPDLIVLDFAMPGLNGFQLAEKISAFAPSLPIILYTF
jgi:CheY-like chemotaxis protein